MLKWIWSGYNVKEYASKGLEYALFIACTGKIFDNNANEGNYMI